MLAAHKLTAHMLASLAAIQPPSVSSDPPSSSSPSPPLAPEGPSVLRSLETKTGVLDGPPSSPLSVLSSARLAATSKALALPVLKESSGIASCNVGSANYSWGTGVVADRLSG